MNKRSAFSPLLVSGLAAISLLSACMKSEVNVDTGTPAPDAGPAVPDAGPPVPDGGVACRSPSGASVPLVEDRQVYNLDGQGVLEMSLTVSDLAGLANVDANAPGAIVDAIFKEGSVGAGVLVPNATLEVRGKTSRLALQKSFKIKLTSKTDVWHGSRVINLNKQPYDLTRVRQQLSFELFRSIPNFTSMRTQWVHLMINGVDRGFYTQIENPDNHFLTGHGLDPNGTIYSPNVWGFVPIDAATAANPVALALIIENKTNPDVPKLLRLAAAVNDPAQDINAVVNRYLNRENYITWLAINLLEGDWDTRSQNFMLYSPQACEGWYFIPWDYDGALGWNEQPGNPPRPRWRAGLANWWAMSLHQRFISDPNNVADIRATMTRLRTTVMSDLNIAALLARYRPVVRPYVSVPPDLWNLPVLPGTTGETAIMAQWDAEYDRVVAVVAGFDAEYGTVASRPMPVDLWQVISPGNIVFMWTPSYDLTGGNLSYEFTLSTSSTFEPGATVSQQTGPGLSMLVTMPPPGTYYWHVITRSDQNPSQNWQVSLADFRKIVIL